jgi:hypothetical protein
MPRVLYTMHMAGGVSMPVTGHMTVSVRRTPGVSPTPVPETAECHDAEAGGTKQQTRDVEIHRGKRFRDQATSNT